MFHAVAGEMTPEKLLAWYREIRRRSRELFDLVAPSAYYARPIALRNPIVFYEGHFPAFGVNALVKKGLGKAGIDERLEVLFARGIDPDSEEAVRNPTDVWPDRASVLGYAAAADALIENAIMNETLEDPARPGLRGGEAIFTILEHEQMHHETLLYMLHNLPYEQKLAPRSPLPVPPAASRVDRGSILIPRGRATLGKPIDSTFGWDNEFPARALEVEAFAIDPHSVTNGDWLEFMSATGAGPSHFWQQVAGRWLWRGMFGDLPLDELAPVYVTLEQATAFAQWKGRRIPTEAEFQRAAYGTPDGKERLHPWGDEAPAARHGNFDGRLWQPAPIGACPDGASAWGVHDLAGNGWEWTATPFRPFDGFVPMYSYPEYSADFFDDAHFVLKGASPATARELIRSSFRNWFRPGYPYVYAKFRCAHTA